MRSATLRWLLFVSLLTPAVASGQDLAGRSSLGSQPADNARPAAGNETDWLTPATKPGAPVRVVERSGKSTTGRLIDVLPSAVRLASDGATIEVPRSEIATVRRNGDSLWSGVAWGGGIAGVMFIGYNGDCDDCYSGAELASFRLAMAGIGAGIGALLDLMVRDQRILYRAPGASASGRLRIQPVVSSYTRGLFLSVGL